MPDVEFSSEEFRLLKDHQIFDVKAGITSKILQLFSRIEDQIKIQLKTIPFEFPENIRSGTGKISRGENYLNSPYIVLDYPRSYSKVDIFAYRTIFWWGHYFSNAFILGGKSYHRYIHRFLDNAGNLRKSDWYICVHKTPWKMEDNRWNYVPLTNLSSEEIKADLKKYTFIKIARIYPLEHYKKLQVDSLLFLSDLLNIIA